MNGLLPEGENLRFEGLEQPLQIERALGSGSQGQVFAAGEIHQTLTSEKISEAFSFGLNVEFSEGRFRVRAR